MTSYEIYVLTIKSASFHLRNAIMNHADSYQMSTNMSLCNDLQIKIYDCFKLAPSFLFDILWYSHFHHLFYIIILEAVKIKISNV